MFMSEPLVTFCLLTIVIFGVSLSQVNKCKVLIVNFELNRVSEFKYLGVVLDDSLTSRAHISQSLNKRRKERGNVRYAEKESHYS